MIMFGMFILELLTYVKKN
ncbi:putative holin-like toxin [Paenibacillus sp. BJ-4]